MFCAVVYTTGRTGSQLICTNLATYFQVPSSYHNQDSNITCGVVHSHNPLWVPKSDDFICVLSKRRNTFNTIISTLVGRISQEWVNYSNKSIDPVIITELDFVSCYWFTRTYYSVIDTSKFKKTIEIYQEDLLEDSKYLFSLFDVDYSTQYNLTKKSPYKYSELVLNFSELKTMFDELEKLPLTNELVNAFKKSIEIDLGIVE